MNYSMNPMGGLPGMGMSDQQSGMMGQTMDMTQQGMMGQSMNVMGQPGMMGQSMDMMGQPGMMGQSMDMMGQPGMMGQPMNMMGQGMTGVDCGFPNLGAFNPCAPCQPEMPHHHHHCPEPAPQPTIYVVRKGDSVYKIAQKFGTTMQAIIIANNLSNPDLIFPGQVFYIPVA